MNPTMPISFPATRLRDAFGTNTILTALGKVSLECTEHPSIPRNVRRSTGQEAWASQKVLWGLTRCRTDEISSKEDAEGSKSRG